VSLVQANTALNAGAGASISATLNGVQSGNLLIVYTSWGTDTTTDFAAVVDGVNNIKWTVDKASGSGHSQGWGQAYAIGVTGGSLTVQVNFNNTPTFRYIIVEEHTPVSAFDKSAMQLQSAPGTGANAITSGVTTAAPGDYVIAGSTDVSNNDAISAGTGFTAGTTISDPGAAQLQTEWLASGAANQAGTFTAATGTDNFVTGIMCFTPAVIGSILIDDGAVINLPVESVTW
jgi:hypothetical protein